MQVNKKTNHLDSYFKGCLSGMFGVALSHPIDTIKTLKQSSFKLNYNLFNLYKGITPPLIGVGLEKALVFGTYQYLRNNNVNVPISGAISGFIATFIVTPYERLKILKQTSQKINKHINPEFLYKGFSATFTREVPGFAIYFSTYHTLKEYYLESIHVNKIDKTDKLSPIMSFLFGGLSGSMAWLFIYPQDRIKTIIQSSTNNDKQINFRTIIKNTYKNGGLKSFYSGFGFAISRAILLHAGTFMMFEMLN
jgi:solute carrier family 25 carnitine/acylcarnitine transporter 20/29